MTVYQQQCLLAYLGYSPGLIDGIDGVQTQAALAAFHRDYGVGADGLVGAIAGTVPRLGTGKTEVNTGSVPIADLTQYLRSDGLYHIPKGINIRLSEHFTSGEFDCQCKRSSCTETLLHPALLSACEDMRCATKLPVTIATSGGSGYRCPAHNVDPDVGGAPGSLHTLGLAADLHCAGISSSRLSQLAEARENYGEIGIYRWGIHLGVFRPDGRHTRWNG